MLTRMLKTAGGGLLLVTLAWGCGAESGSAGVGGSAGSGGHTPVTAEWIDFHMHCAKGDMEHIKGAPVGPEDKCPAEDFLQFSDSAHGVLLSLGHFAALSAANHAVAGEDEDKEGQQYQNANNQNTAAESPRLHWFASLPCWHEQKISEIGWAAWETQCKDDTSALLAAGASGFKDHAGKLRVNEVPSKSEVAGLTVYHGLGCTGVTNLDECSNDPSLVFFADTPEYREVLRYILQDLQVPYTSHASTAQEYDGCYDSFTGKTSQSCKGVSAKHLVALAEYLQAELLPDDADARRRLNFSHLNFMTPSQLDVLLDTGVSTDVSAMQRRLGRAGDNHLDAACEWRRLFNAYKTQILFGTDAFVGKIAEDKYPVWMHILSGGIEEGVEFVIGGDPPTTYYGLDLDTPSVPQCSEDIDADVLEHVVRRNAAWQLGLTLVE